MKRSLFALLLVAGCVPHPVLARVLQGRALRVIDGDTLYVETTKVATKVRLWGVDAPELSQPYGQTAKQMAEIMAGHDVVRVKVMGTDIYGRTLGIVVLPGGQVLNERMLALGLAWYYRQYAPRARSYADLERQAREDHAGLWAGLEPMAPWEYRRLRKLP